MAEKTRVKITRNTFIGGQAVTSGEEVVVSLADAKNLLAMGKAVPAGDQTKLSDSASDDEELLAELAAMTDSCAKCGAELEACTELVAELEAELAVLKALKDEQKQEDPKVSNKK